MWQQSGYRKNTHKNHSAYMSILITVRRSITLRLGLKQPVYFFTIYSIIFQRSAHSKNPRVYNTYLHSSAIKTGNFYTKKTDRCIYNKTNKLYLIGDVSFRLSSLLSYSIGIFRLSFIKGLNRFRYSKAFSFLTGLAQLLDMVMHFIHFIAIIFVFVVLNIFQYFCNHQTKYFGEGVKL